MVTLTSMYPFLTMLFLLVGWHVLADFPLQGPYVSDAKNRNTVIGSQVWKWVLPYHGFIHGLGVMVITGSLWLGLLEVVIHCLIDYRKCANKISFSTDQILHLLCKVIWAVVAVDGITHVTHFVMPVH